MDSALGYQVGFVVYPGFQLQHVAGPLATFEAVGGFGVSPYEALFVSATGGIVPSSARAQIGTAAFADAGQFDILFIAGGFAAIEAERSREIAAFIVQMIEPDGDILGDRAHPAQLGDTRGIGKGAASR